MTNLSTFDGVENVIGKAYDNGEFATVNYGLRGTKVNSTEEISTVVDEHREMILRTEVDAFNNETGILTLGINSPFDKDEYDMFAKNMRIIRAERIDNDNKLRVCVEWDGVWNNRENSADKRTMRRAIVVELDSVSTDTLKDHPTSIRNFLKGERTDRTFSDTIHRLIRNEERKLRAC